MIGQDISGGADHHVIYKVDLTTDKILRRIRTPDIGIYGRTIYAFGALWEIGQGTGTLLRVDASTGATRRYHEPGDAGLSEGYEIFPLAAQGSIWVRISDGSILRINPTTGRVLASYPGDQQSAGMLAFADGDLWVANVQAGTIWREHIRPSS